jgi:hypothetical protein
MTSKSRELLYQKANDHDLVLKDVQNKGKHWYAHLSDPQCPGRKQGYVSHSLEIALGYIERYASNRANWQAANPSAAGTIVEFVDRPIEVEKIVEIEKILTVVGQDHDAYEAGFNDGLTEGMGVARAAVADPNLVTIRRDEWDLNNAEISLLKHDNGHFLGENSQLKAALKARDVALVALRQQFIDSTSMMDTAHTSLDRALSEALRVLNRTRTPPVPQVTIDHRANMTDKILAAVNLRVENDEVKDTP